MSERIRIEPAGLYLYRWDGDIRKYRRSRVKRARVLTHLRSSCTIKPGTTLGDIFNAVDQYPRLRRFIAQYSWCPDIEAFHAQAREPMRSEPDDDPLDRLEIGCYAEVSEFKPKGKPVESSYGLSLDFSGIGLVKDPGTFQERKGYPPPESGEIHYGVSYSPVYDIADLPVRIKTELKIRHMAYKGKSSGELIRTEYKLSLLEVLDAIYWDISFMGGPADNAEFLEDMKDTMAQFDAGELETKPLDLDELTDDE